MRTLIILFCLLLIGCGQKKTPSKGVDVSYHNKLTNSDWKKLKSRNVKFVYIKATEGATHKDRMLFSHYKKAKKHNMYVGAYLFFRDNVSAKRQFNNYKEAVNGMNFDLLPCIDYEKEGFRRNFKTRIKILKQLNALFVKHYNVRPVIYCDLANYSKIKPFLPHNVYWISASSPDVGIGSIKQSIGRVNGKRLDFNKGNLSDIMQ